MKIKTNKSIDLKNPKFLVDDYINKDLNEYEVFRHINKYNTTALIGASGSGKTSLMYSFIMNQHPKIYKKQFENLIVVMPENSRNSLKNNIFDKYLNETQLFENLDNDTIDIIHEQINENSQNDLKTLLILDDVASSLKNSYVAKKLQHLIYAYRHYKVVILMLCQTLKTIPISIRKNLTNLIVFYKPRMNEWNNITEEFLEMNKKDSIQLYNLVFKEKYDWILINLSSGKIYNKFDEVIYKE
jgi:ABC-type dipeptide/oligopeptide/nickel transport system ATPase subunit